MIKTITLNDYNIKNILKIKQLIALMILIILILEIVAIFSFIALPNKTNNLATPIVHSQRQTNSNSALSNVTNNPSTSSQFNSPPNSTILPQNNQIKSSFASNSILSSSSQSTSTSNFAQTIRVDYLNYVTPTPQSVKVYYNYDPIYPSSFTLQQSTYPACPPGACSSEISEQGPLALIDASDGQYFIPYITMSSESGGIYSLGGYATLYLDITGLSGQGTLYAHNFMTEKGNTGDSLTASWNVQTSASTTNTWTPPVYPSLASYAVTNPYPISEASQTYLEPYIYLMMQTDISLFGHTAQMYMDQVYFQPSTVVSNYIETLVNNNNGTITHFITIDPISTTSTNGITVQKPSGWTLLSISNSYSSISTSTGNITIKGLPANVNTVLTFTSNTPTTTKIVYTTASSYYQGVGKFLNTVTVSPLGPAVKIYNSSDWVFSTASNSFSSLNVSNGVTILSGLPMSIQTTVTFLSDNSQNAFSLKLNNTIVPNSSNLNCLYQYNGFCSYLASSNLIFGTNNSPLLGTYMVNIIYFGYNLTSLGIRYYNNGILYTQVLDANNSIWHSIWIYINVNVYSNNIAFTLLPTQYLYFAYCNIYSFNYTTSNNINGNALISGQMNYLTEYGLFPSTFLNTTFQLFQTSSNNKLQNICALTNSDGYFSFNAGSLNNESYYINIFKTASSFTFPQDNKSNNALQTAYVITPLSNAQISYSITENTIAYILSQDKQGSNLYVKVWLDNVYQGVFESNQVIYKSSTVGTHTFSYLLIASDDYLIGGSVFVNQTYTNTEPGTETLIFRNEQGTYVDPNTFNVYVGGTRVIDGTFTISDITNPFNLTITDAWNYIIYSNTSEVYAQYKDFILPLHSINIQDTQLAPVWIQVQRVGSGATYSQWLFTTQVVTFYLYSPANYSLTWNYAYYNFDNDSYSINYKSYVSLQFQLTNDMAFRISGTDITDVFTNIGTVISQINQTNIDLQKVNVSISDLNNYTNFYLNAYNSNLSLLAQEIHIVNSTLNGNFNLASQTFTLLGQLSGDISIQSQFLNVMNSSIMGNMSLLTTFLNVSSSILKDNNITLFSQIVSLINTAVQGNLTLVTQNTLSMLHSLATINASLLDQLSFQVIVSNYYLSDNYVNIYAVATRSYNYYIYENNTLVATGQGERAGSFLDFPRNTFTGALIYVSVKFVNDTNFVWFNSTYSNSMPKTDIFNIVLVSPGGLILSPYPILVYVDYNFNRHIISSELYDISQSMYIPNSTLVNVSLRSGFNDLIYNKSFIINSDYSMRIQVNISTLIINNAETYSINVLLWRHNILGYNTTINPGESTSVSLIPGYYFIQVYEILNKPYVNSKNQTITRQLIDYTGFTLHSIGTKLNFSSVGAINANNIKSWLGQIDPATFLTLVLSGAVGTFVGIIIKRFIMQKIHEKERYVKVTRNNY